jgi:hypothetical protein
VPFPEAWVEGGFRYILGSAVLEVCGYMYVSTQTFFKLDSVQLEDMFVGYSALSVGLPLHSYHDGVPFSTASTVEQEARPGLKRVV